MFNPQDHQYMRRALQLAQQALYITSPNPRVGCVLVKDGFIIGEGQTQKAGSHHAEVMAVHDARTKGHDTHGSTAYVTLEPCSHFGRTPPCTELMISAGVIRVIAAMEDPNPLVAGKGLTRLRDVGMEVRCGLFAQEAADLNPGFVSRMLRGMPWVRLKVAASLDGRTALANGASQWITGQAARDDGHHWRARACAVLTGIGTIRADNPQLNVRAVPTPRQPRRVVVDARLELPLEAKILHSSGGNVTVVHAQPDNHPRAQALRDHGVQLLTVAADANGKNDLQAMLKALAQDGINELHVEAGSKLNGSLIAAGLVDELLLYIAPTLLGPGEPLAQMPELTELTQANKLTVASTQMLGEDIRVIARFAKPTTAGAA
jgi:diaminohydroxyphosphoribosylaminopyrimidine deaminase / 5-amino-6-(5-phosphoribosylamino)uracil reductase